METIYAPEQIKSLTLKALGNIPAYDFVPKVNFLGKEDLEYGTAKKFRFDNQADSVVYGYLFVPKDFDQSKKYAVVQYPHWHGGMYELGKRELLDEKSPNALLQNLLAANIIVFSIDAYGFGERRDNDFTGIEQEWYLAKYYLLYGKTLSGMMLRDEFLLLNFIKSLPYVTTDRIGVAGISMGCTKALWLGSLSNDYKVVVGINCTTRITDLIEKKGLNLHGIYYYPFGLLSHFDTEVLYSNIAPKDLLIINAELDKLTPMKGVQYITDYLKEHYKKRNALDRFQSTIYSNIGHEFTSEMVNETTEFLTKRL